MIAGLWDYEKCFLLDKQWHLLSVNPKLKFQENPGGLCISAFTFTCFMEDFNQNIQNQLILTFVIVADGTVAQIDNAENRTAKTKQNGFRVEQWINLKYPGNQSVKKRSIRWRYRRKKC